MSSYKLPADQVLRVIGMDGETEHKEQDLLCDTLLNISQQVIQYRKENNITNKEFADMCGITTSIVSRIESGYQNLSLKTVCRVLSVMGKELIIK